MFPFSLLEDRVTRLHGQLQRHQQLISSAGSSSIDNKVLDDLYEDIHWLILVTGEQRLLHMGNSDNSIGNGGSLVKTITD